MRQGIHPVTLFVVVTVGTALWASIVWQAVELLGG